uniref:Uncharacterized protein n=1 Tax=Monodon monoceros TaxID=40151 RepID=A0A8C6C3C9_MONMO
VDLPVPVKSSDDCSPSQHFYYNLMKDSTTQLSHSRIPYPQNWKLGGGHSWEAS